MVGTESRYRNLDSRVINLTEKNGGLWGHFRVNEIEQDLVRLEQK